MAINYHTANLAPAVNDAAPDGVDVYVDNTGGTILGTLRRQMRVAGRVLQCGTASIDSWLSPLTGLRNEREILTRRLAWSGVVLSVHIGAYAVTADRLAEMHRAGAITYDVDIDGGIEYAPGSIAALYAGANTGKKLIYVGWPPRPAQESDMDVQLTGQQRAIDENVGQIRA